MADERPMYETVLERGISTLGDYMLLVQAVIVDWERGVVTNEQAVELVRYGAPENVELPEAAFLATLAAMCAPLLDAIERGEASPDGAAARSLVAALRNSPLHHPLVERARALGVRVDDA